MKRTFKKLMCVFMVVALCTALCVPAFAAEGSKTEPKTPAGYTYLTSNKGDARVDATISNLGLNIALGLIGGPLGTAFNIAFIIGDVFSPPSDIMGKYTDYIYECDDPGIYPYIYWHKVRYDVTVNDGNKTVTETRWTSFYEYALLPR